MSVPLLPRKLLFGNPDKTGVQISPDGTQIAFLAPLDGVLNLWVAPRDDIEAACAVTHDTGRGIRVYFWAYDNTHILYLRDKNGDENWRIYAVDLKNSTIRDLTPFEGVQARVQEVSHRFPGEILVALNNRNPQLHDLYRVNLSSGELTEVRLNEGFLNFLTDQEFNVRAGARMNPDGGIELFRLTPTGWVPWESIPAEDSLTTDPVAFDKTGNYLYMLDSRGRNTAALTIRNMVSGEVTVMAEDARADISGVVLHPRERFLQAVYSTYERKQWKIFDPALKPDLEALQAVEPGEVEITSRTLDDRYWTVAFVLDNAPLHFYLYDRQTKQARFLFSNRQELEGLPLAKMNSAVIQTRDGLDMVIYYTLPVGSDADGDGIPDQPLPLVSLPHGGPWGRDVWGLNSWHQWLANRGYAALSMNFRASTGFGKAFLNAGNKEWGGKILEDQIDAIQWAAQQGIADAAKVGVMGGSFGGYSALAGLTFFPEQYACGVDLVGPSNLITLLESIPPYWKPMLENLTSRMGDHRTDAGRALLRKHSPLGSAEKIRVPLLIGQGANDPRVKKAESDQIVQAMQAKGLPVTYVLYPDEGHGFARPENNLSFNAIAEAFLAQSLGGRFEPIADDFSGSSLQVLAGAEGVPGLADQLSAAQPAQN